VGGNTGGREGKPAMQKEMEATLTSEHQVNLPNELLQNLGWQPGDRLIVTVFPGDVVTLRRQPKKWTGHPGQMGDVWGDHEDNMRYLDEERASWDDSVLTIASDGTR
jgi:bifunctional DNA-binding transcriptional regulator/antitoxin component of YhaV-PrlF toxin-antitoxin module